LAVALSVTGDPPEGEVFDAANDTVHPDEEAPPHATVTVLEVASTGDAPSEPETFAT
jgi:hypothetical protein